MSRETSVLDLDRKSGNADTLLDVRGLKTHFVTDEGIVHAVDGVDLTVRRGETAASPADKSCGRAATSFRCSRTK
jgi:peptide/nickel transport system ATP-binding protein